MEPLRRVQTVPDRQSEGGVEGALGVDDNICAHLSIYSNTVTTMYRYGNTTGYIFSSEALTIFNPVSTPRTFQNIGSDVLELESECKFHATNIPFSLISNPILNIPIECKAQLWG